MPTAQNLTANCDISLQVIMHSHYISFIWA